MVDLRSETRDVRVERRQDPRLEFHCDATVIGIGGLQIITDISLGGIFIETNLADKIEAGQIVTVSTKLPTERSILRFKARVVNKTDRGIGCQFISMDKQNKEAICLCFEMFKDTLPAGCE